MASEVAVPVVEAIRKAAPHLEKSVDWAALISAVEAAIPAIINVINVFTKPPGA